MNEAPKFGSNVGEGDSPVLPPAPDWGNDGDWRRNKDAPFSVSKAPVEDEWVHDNPEPTANTETSEPPIGSRDNPAVVETSSQAGLQAVKFNQQ